MIKTLSVPDFHFDTRWIEVSKKCGEAVRLAAIKNDIDIILIPGDWFNRPIMASDKGGLNEAKAIIKSLLSVCAVVAIEGTPSHDAPGCYGIFEDLGLVVLRTNKVYGFWRTLGIKEVKNNDIPSMDAILFGIPELSKKNVIAQLGLPAEEATGATLHYLERYIDEFVAPMRLKHSGLPAFGLLHGNVSDSKKENETDNILKRSDLVIHTEILERANLTRWEFGHIHTPWESKVVNGGYAGFPGMDDNPWGKRDFIPAFNFFDGNHIERLPYGTPERIKLSINSGDDFPHLNPAAAYWIETDNEALTHADFTAHEWSKVTYAESKNETRRATEAEVEQAKTLWETLRLMDNDLGDKYKPLIDEISETIPKPEQQKKEIVVKSVEVKGCKLFGKHSVKIDLSNLNDTLNALDGENGQGKSSLLGFLSPYPLIIGKDTKSGRNSAIKDFFTEKESWIKKEVIVNGESHIHQINIKAAHTKSPKVECYLTVNGIPKLDKGSFDEMFSECEFIYGPYNDYLLTSFYVQPLQGKTQTSLMSATITEARDLVQNIAGIDRSRERRYGLDRMSETEKERETAEIKLEVLESGLGLSSFEIKDAIDDKKADIKLITSDIKNIESRGKTLKIELARLKLFNDTNKERILKKATIQNELSKLKSKMDSKSTELISLKNSVSSLEENRKVLADEEIKAKKLNDLTIKQKDALERNEELRAEWDIKMDHYRDTVNKRDRWTHEFDNMFLEIGILDAKIKGLEPCEHCGKLSNKAELELIPISSKYEALKAKFDNLGTNPHKVGDKPQEPEYTTIEDDFELYPRKDLFLIESLVKTAEEAEAKIIQLEKEIKDGTKKIDELLRESDLIILDDTIEPLLRETERKIESSRADWNEKKADLIRSEESLKSLERDLIDLNAKIKEIEELKTSISSLKEAEQDWKYIASLFGSNKLPAFELDVIIDSIDKEATRIIEPFLGGRYSYRTTTQENGVDKFNIMLHDRETGEEFSMFFTNPGNKAFYSDCYIKALIRKRNEISMRSYSPIISDEADAPIKDNRVRQFYEIQNREAERRDEKVLIVSQKTEVVQAYISNVINMEDLYV